MLVMPKRLKVASSATLVKAIVLFVENPRFVVLGFLREYIIQHNGKHSLDLLLYEYSQKDFLLWCGNFLDLVKYDRLIHDLHQHVS